MNVTESLILNGVTVVDTRTGQLTRDRALVIEDGIIRKIASSGSISSQAGSQVIGARGKFAVPGFWDMHAHILEDEHRGDSLALMLAHGITGWRQMSGSPKLLEQRKQGGLDLGPDAPELLEMPGHILTPANAPTPAASIAEVGKQKREGADFIKTITVSPQTFFASCKEARRLGLGYAGHLSLGVSAEDASEAGMTAIEHLGPLDLQLISCSSRGWLVKLILKLKPPPAPDLSPEKMGTIGKLIVANPTLFRLQMDPGGLAKSQRLVDSFSEAKCRNLGEVCVANRTWQVPTLIRIETNAIRRRAALCPGPKPALCSGGDPQVLGVGRAAVRRKSYAGRQANTAGHDGKALQMTKIFDVCGVKMLAGSDYGGMWVIPGRVVAPGVRSAGESGPVALARAADDDAGWRRVS